MYRKTLYLLGAAEWAECQEKKMLPQYHVRLDDGVVFWHAFTDHEPVEIGSDRYKMRQIIRTAATETIAASAALQAARCEQQGTRNLHDCAKHWLRDWPTN